MTVGILVVIFIAVLVTHREFQQVRREIERTKKLCDKEVSIMMAHFNQLNEKVQEHIKGGK